MPIHLTTELETYNDYAEFFHYQVSLAQYVAIRRVIVIHQYHPITLHTECKRTTT